VGEFMILNKKSIFLTALFLSFSISSFTFAMEKDEQQKDEQQIVVKHSIKEKDDKSIDNFNNNNQKTTQPIIETDEVSENNFRFFKEKYTREEILFAQKQFKKMKHTNLTRDLLNNNQHRNFIGNLYNKDLEKYVQTGTDNKWIYANAEGDNPLEFVVRKFNRGGDTEVIAQINQNTMFLNWRYTTGCVKLHGDYNKMTFTNWNGDVFEICHDRNQFMGTKNVKDSLKENALYYGENLYNTSFQYHFVNEESLNEIDKNIYKCYVKHTYESVLIETQSRTLN
jgi:hypothetical protein